MSDAASDNWDQHWEEIAAAAEQGPAHQFRRRTMLRLLDVPNIDGPAALLEIGCGTGEFAEAFLKRYPSAAFLGLDMSRVGVEVSSQRVPHARFQQRNLLRAAPAEEPPERFANLAICSEVLEHIDDPVLLLLNASEYMAPGCKLVVTVPGGPMSAFDRHIGHRRHYTPAELKNVLERAGFTVEAAFGAGFPFFNLYRATMILRGNKLRGDISGSPSRKVKFAMALFDVLFHFTSMRRGWQVIAVARYQG